MKFSMDMEPRQSQEQKQQLAMTPRLRMAIEILQLNTQQLQEFLSERLLENPLLEKEEKELRERIENHRSTAANSPAGRGGVGGGEREQFKKFIGYNPPLLEHLENQLPEILDQGEMEPGRYILASLDETGLLQTDIVQIAAEIGADPDSLESVRQKLMYLDPPGIAATSSREAMEVQLDIREVDPDSPARRLLEKTGEKLEDMTLNQLCQEVSFEEERALAALARLKKLNPHPASAFDGAEEKASYIEPDVILRRVRGEYQVELNGRASPALTINERYYQMMKNAEEEEASEFLRSKFQSALWLIKAVERRRMTLERITREIAKRQSEFLEKGLRYLRPLTMEDVAEAVDVHESTVSRACRDKYIQTERGLFKMRFFFAGGVGDTATPAIKSILSSLVEGESKNNPLSDRKIAEKMEKEYGIELSRRTVAKYRNALGIPSSLKRRRWKYQI